MITVEQIKAARAMLDWTQMDLAKAARVSKPAINNLERRVVQPRSHTLQYLRRALEQAGIEFIDQGVRFSQEPLNIKVLEGGEAFFRLMQDIIDTFGEEGGEVLMSSISEERFLELGEKKLFKYLEQYKSLNIREHILIQEGDDHFITDPECYRWLSSTNFMDVPYMVYDNKYAIILWEPTFKIVVIENPQIADSYRKQFFTTWDNARPVTEKS